LEQRSPGLAEAFGHYAAADAGDFEGTDLRRAKALAETDVIRDQVVEKIGQEGVLFDEAIRSGGRPRRSSG
jgi:hypothetical protein